MTTEEKVPAWALALDESIALHNQKLDALYDLANEAMRKVEPMLPDIMQTIERLQKSPVIKMLGGF